MSHQTASSVVRTRNFDLRELMLQVHLYLGLIFVIPIIFMGVSGSVLMLSRPGPGAGDPVPVGRIAAIVDAARALAPKDAVPVSYLAPVAGDPATVRFISPSEDRGTLPDGTPIGAATRIAVDPVTLAARPVETASSRSFMSVLADLHTSAAIDGRLGRTIIGWLGVFMCLMGLTGIVVWWPRAGQWRRAFTFSVTRNGLRFSREFHGAIGVWGLILFIIVASSGVYLAIGQTVIDVVGAGPELRANRARVPVRVTPVAGQLPLDADGIAAVARTAISGGVVRYVALVSSPEAAVRVLMTREGQGKGAARIGVFVDPWAKRVAEVRDPQTYSARDKMLAWAGGLHTGLGFGKVWWTLEFLTGLLPVALGVTGVTIWALKRRNKARVRSTQRAPATTAAESLS